MKVNKIITLLVVILLSSSVVLAIYLLAKEYLRLWPSEPTVQGDFSSKSEWVFSADRKIISSPTAKNYDVFIKTQTTLYALNILENRIKWKVASVTNRDLVLSPIVVSSLVIVIEDASTLAAYSIESGELVWKTKALRIVESGKDPLRSISFNSQYLYVARFDWDITAYDLKSGDVIWEHSLPGRSDPHLAANEEYVFFTAGEDSSGILDATTGRDVWSYDMEGYFGPVLLSGDTLYISDELHASLISMDINSHQFHWTKELPIATYEFSCIVDMGDNILVAAQKLIMVSKQDGTIVWVSDELGNLECPISLNNDIFVRNNQTDLYMIDKESGHEVGKLHVRANTLMKADFFRSPIIVKDLLVVPFGDDRLFVYKP